MEDSFSGVTQAYTRLSKQNPNSSMLSSLNLGKFCTLVLITFDVDKQVICIHVIETVGLCTITGRK